MQLAGRGVAISRLAKSCFLEDYCDEGEKPGSYLRAVLKGKKNLQYPVLDRLNCELNLRSDRVFPFKRGGEKPVAVAEYVLFPVA